MSAAAQEAKVGLLGAVLFESICSVANYDLVGFELEGLLKTVQFGEFQAPKLKTYNPKSPHVRGGLPCQISSAALGIL
jgi:hypothetical protein